VTSEVGREICAGNECKKSFPSHLAGIRQAWKDGWFIGKFGVTAWCPDHLPDWAMEHLGVEKKTDIYEAKIEDIYQQFVVENYYGGDSEPITPEYFRECWAEMSDDEKAGLFKRTVKKP
jgi:hypothetical protein